MPFRRELKMGVESKIDELDICAVLFVCGTRGCSYNTIAMVQFSFPGITLADFLYLLYFYVCVCVVFRCTLFSLMFSDMFFSSLCFGNHVYFVMIKIIFSDYRIFGAKWHDAHTAPVHVCNHLHSTKCFRTIHFHIGMC